MGIKVYPVIVNDKQYIEVLLPDKTTHRDPTPVSGKQLNDLMSKKYIEYAKKFNP